VELTAVPVAQPGKIEVVELFWYGCQHCFTLEPSLNAWIEKLPADVNFVRVPAIVWGDLERARPILSYFGSHGC
jgi:thiol:disulfide interchange protein DsbA